MDKKIVHLGKYYPPDMGGIESVTRSLAQGAQAAGCQVSVVCFHQDAAQDERQANGLRVLRAPVDFIKASQPVGGLYLQWALAQGRRADLVHLHAPNMLAALSALLLGSTPRLLVHWHSDVVNKGALGRILRPLERWMLRRADQIACTSAAYAESSLALRPFAHKVTVVPIGVPDLAKGIPTSGDDALFPELRARLRDRKMILSVGRMVPYKGFDVLVEAALRLPDDAVVVIVGSGPLREELERQIDGFDLGDKVILAGRQSDEALAALFRRATLFCLPSVERSEAFGVVLIEAMAYGLPVIATQIPGSGVPWVNQQEVSGLNVPVRDAAALADACTAVLASDALRHRLAAGARHRFETEFTEEISVRRMLHLYDSMLRPGSSRLRQR